jgi:hypothetical protein
LGHKVSHNDILELDLVVQAKVQDLAGRALEV